MRYKSETPDTRREVLCTVIEKTLRATPSAIQRLIRGLYREISANKCRRKKFFFLSNIWPIIKYLVLDIEVLNIGGKQVLEDRLQHHLLVSGCFGLITTRNTR
jgi:hypothetical protein